MSGLRSALGFTLLTLGACHAPSPDAPAPKATATAKTATAKAVLLLSCDVEVTASTQSQRGSTSRVSRLNSRYRINEMRGTVEEWIGEPPAFTNVCESNCVFDIKPNAFHWRRDSRKPDIQTASWTTVDRYTGEIKGMATFITSDGNGTVKLENVYQGTCKPITEEDMKPQF